MLRLPLAALAVLSLPAQVRDNGYVEVTVSRQLQPGASEAVFDVNADVPASTGLAQVAAKLEAVGVRAEHLTRADSTFRFPVLRLGVAEPARF